MKSDKASTMSFVWQEESSAVDIEQATKII